MKDSKLKVLDFKTTKEPIKVLGVNLSYNRRFHGRGRHTVKHGVEWSGVDWSAFVKHRFVKGGFVKGGFVKGGFVKYGFVKGGFVKGGFVKHGFVKGGFVKHDNLKLKRVTRKVRIFFSRRSQRKPCRGQ